jgi:hypothetical protein
MDQTKEQMKDKAKLNAWRMAVTCGSALFLLLLVLALNQIRYLFQPGPAEPAATNTIMVSGTGSVTAIPNIATFDFGVTETATTVAAAQTAATAKINTAISALTSAGVATSDVQTLSYDINPHYSTVNQPCVYNTVVPVPVSAPAIAPTSAVNGTASAESAVSSGSVSSGISSGVMIPYCPGQKTTLTGYDVSETIQVKVRDITKAGSLFQTIGSLGVQNVNDLQFSIDNVETVQDQARSAAITDARTNADKLASELGVHLVRIVGFNDNSSSGIVPMMYAQNAMAVSGSAAAPAPAIPQGQQKVTDNVSVTYEVR